MSTEFYGFTKENFFNDLQEKHPLAMKEFCTWIDKYKQTVNWTDLFKVGTKFHHLPFAMQIGIMANFFNNKAEGVDRIKFSQEDIEGVTRIREDFYMLEDKLKASN